MVVRIEGGERGEENTGEKGEVGGDNGERERWEREAGNGWRWREEEDGSLLLWAKGNCAGGRGGEQEMKGGKGGRGAGKGGNGRKWEGGSRFVNCFMPKSFGCIQRDAEWGILFF